MTAPGCLAPASCPVPGPGVLGRRRPRLAAVPEGRELFRVYPVRYGHDAFNPGVGNARFSPFTDTAGAQVPTLYAGEDEIVALLETVFHEVGPTGDRVIYERALRDRGLAHIALPDEMLLADFRDPELARLGITRHQLVATDPAHYACTREWARWVHGRTSGGRPAQGMVWHSRKAELVAGPALEAIVLFGDRVPNTAGAYPLRGPGVRNLVEGIGRLRVDEIAEELDALVEPMGVV